MRDFSRSRVHFPDLEVCCDRSTFFPLKSADVSGAGTREKPLRTSAWEATVSKNLAHFLLNTRGNRTLY